MGVVGGCDSLEHSSRCKQDSTFSDHSFRSYGPKTQMFTPPGAGMTKAPIVSPPNVGGAKVEALVVR